jgi:hypothetical protein
MDPGRVKPSAQASAGRLVLVAPNLPSTYRRLPDCLTNIAMLMILGIVLVLLQLWLT